MANEDAILARQCAEGNNKARETLYRKYAARVYMLCLRYLADPELSKDIAHDCFIRIFDTVYRYDPAKSSLRTWISRITINYAIDYLRKHRKKSFMQIEGQVLNIPEINTESDYLKIPEDVILEMITKLPDVKRIVFNLYCVEDYSHKEIADMLGIKEKTSSSLLFKARKQLSEMIADYKKEISE